jgi:hypothetical protein
LLVPVGLVLVPLKTEVIWSTLLVGVVGLFVDVFSVVPDDWELERGFQPLCLSIMIADFGGGELG